MQGSIKWLRGRKFTFGDKRNRVSEKEYKVNLTKAEGRAHIEKPVKISFVFVADHDPRKFRP